MRNIRLKLAYDGTNYHGFQRQPENHGPTIQGTLEAIWEKLVNETITLTAAGRTDAGVHALGQVANFKTEAGIPEDKIPKAFNSLLPVDIRVLEAEKAAETFNARFGAQWKRYDYQVDNNQIPHVLLRLYAYHVPEPLDIALMREAANLFEGRHNFKTFAAAGGGSKTFERSLYRCLVKEKQGVITVSCVGDGFLYHMVRIIVGTLVDVGKSRILPQRIPEIIASQERKQAAMIAPAHGLILRHIQYSEESPFEVFKDLGQELSPQA